MQQVFVSSKALIVHEYKFLILKQQRADKFYWDLPGGKIEYGESPEQTLLREVKEETDLDVSIENILGNWWFFSVTNRFQVVCITYLCSPQTIAIDLSKNPAKENIQEYKWITKAEFLTGEYPFLNTSIEKIISKV